MNQEQTELLRDVNELAEQMGVKPFEKIPHSDSRRSEFEMRDRSQYGTGRTTWMVLHAVQAMRMGEDVVIVTATLKGAQCVREMVHAAWRHTRPDLPAPEFQVISAQRDVGNMARGAKFWDHENPYIRDMRARVARFDAAQERIGLTVISEGETPAKCDCGQLLQVTRLCPICDDDS